MSTQQETSGLPRKPRLNISYHVIGMDGDRVQFRKGQDLFVIKGAGLLELAQELFPLLTGELSCEDIIQRLEGKHSRENITGLLSRLVQRHVVREAAEESMGRFPILDVQKVYFSQFTRQPEINLRALVKSSVTVVGLGPVGASLAETLARSGVGTITIVDDSIVSDDDIRLCGYPSGALGVLRRDIFITRAQKIFPDVTWEFSTELEEDAAHDKPSYMAVCLENYDPALLERVNSLSMSLEIPYTWCCLDGFNGTIGPTVLPHETSCFKCYSTRVLANADYPEELQAYEEQLVRQGNSTVFGYLPPHVQILSGLAALEVVKDLSGLTPPLTYNAQLEVNLLSMEFALHPTLKLPRCPVCGRLQHTGAVVNPFAEQLR